MPYPAQERSPRDRGLARARQLGVPRLPYRSGQIARGYAPREGVCRPLSAWPPGYRRRRARLEYELKVIIDKGFAPYFLVVADLLDFAKQAGILTTTRGSAAGSLVSYTTGITNVDPLAINCPSNAS
jgi:hypothetical protein